MKGIKAVIFDLDGTLTYTLQDLTDAVNYALAYLGYKLRALDEVRGFVGDGIRKLVERALPQNCDQDVLDNCYKKTMEYYVVHSTDHTVPYENMVELLTELNANGIKVGVVTNKVIGQANEIVRRFFDDSVSYISGDDGVTKLKPSSEGVEKCLKFFSVLPEEIYYVGDGAQDAKTATNANADFIYVSWGYGQPESLKNYDVKHSVSNAKELREILLNCK
ncbi:MAG: HAD-IA family hydrolase [Clostridia bacterium]